MKTVIHLSILSIFLTLSINVSAENPYDQFDSNPVKLYDESAYSECILKNTKANMSPYAVAQISEACSIKATPKKCRGLATKGDIGACINECKSAGMWSRKFGDCSTGD